MSQRRAVNVEAADTGEVEHERSIGTLVLDLADRGAEAAAPEPPASSSGRPARAWWGVAALVGIGAVALLVRVWRLDALGFNSDEAVYAGQAAALAGNPRYVELFPAFRAHPLLFQAILSPVFRVGDVDVAGRVVVALFGVATVLAVYLLGARLYTRRVGLLAALLVAVMPYHVVVTRQVLLDGPMVLFSTLAIHCFVRFVESQRLAWFVAAGGVLGVAMLTKETSVVLAGAVYAFLALTPTIRRPVRYSLAALATAMAVFAAHPISQALAGHTGTGKSYLVWQLFRRPNHPFGFYAQTVPLAIGLLVVVAALGGLWWWRRERSWRETLLLSWILVPVVFFQVWPVKGFQYLLPVVPPMAVLAARGLISLPLPRRRVLDLPLPRSLIWLPIPRRVLALPLPRWLDTARIATVVRPAVIGAVVLSLLVPTWSAISRQDTTTFLAGSGGVPGGRETGRWLAENTPAGSVVLTLGPSMANIVQYYGHRRSYGLSVSPNPLHRNPSYVPLPNPDWWLRHNELQYVVWDAFSADRSPFFAERLLTLARRYHGRVVHTEYVQGKDAQGSDVLIPVIVVYEVRP